MKKYFIYYDENNNGSIVSVSPVEMKEFAGQPFLVATEGEALPFIQGKEKVSRWKVDMVKEPVLVKKDNYVFHQYDSHGFFDVATQKSEKPIITVKIANNVITISALENEHGLAFYLTKKDNPSYFLQKMCLEPKVIEKVFISDEDEFSIFTMHNYGMINYETLSK